MSKTRSPLRQLDDRLRHMQRRGILSRVRYEVPERWAAPESELCGTRRVDPLAFWRERLGHIISTGDGACIQGERGEWSRRAVVYSLFIRAACAFDHDGDGAVHVLNRHGLRETGTFLKAITLLPYIRSLGCNVVHVLPITRIGLDGRKGSLGSPYASANPYELDEGLSEPLIQLGPEVEFHAFVEAAHRLGLRVVLEFAFRTAAKDSEWVIRHPEWFYWIGADQPGVFGPPRFSSDDLALMRRKIALGDFDGLPEPEPSYRERYTHPPMANSVRKVDGGYVGETASGAKVRIPGAFPDWPPDDSQPPWTDVTYLRLYDYEEFNYMAYNTVRMYDRRLAKPEYEVAGLWDRISGVLPYYETRYGVDGAMIDMGHALPASLKARIVAGARGVTPEFAFWDEAFESTETAGSEGYNAVAGNLWWTLHRPKEFARAVALLARGGTKLPGFATPETHNTPRCAARPGGLARSRCLWLLGAFLPAIPYLHSGFELGERVPVNTGLDFSSEEARAYPEETLPLYNAVAYDWLSDDDLRRDIRVVAALRAQMEDIIVDPSPGTMSVLHTDQEACVGYIREQGTQALVVAGNTGNQAIRVTLSRLPFADEEVADLLSGLRHVIRNGSLTVALAPWQTLTLARL